MSWESSFNFIPPFNLFNLLILVTLIKCLKGHKYLHNTLYCKVKGPTWGHALWWRVEEWQRQLQCGAKQYLQAGEGEAPWNTSAWLWDCLKWEILKEKWPPYKPHFQKVVATLGKTWFRGRFLFVKSELKHCLFPLNNKLSWHRTNTGF